MSVDFKSMSVVEAVRLLNSTPLGEVTSAAATRRQLDRAGYRIGDGQRINLLRYASWLFAETHPTAASAPAITSQRKLLSVLKDHGIVRSLPALQNALKRPAWREAGFSTKPPWSATDVPAMVAWYEDAQEQERTQAQREEKRKRTIEEDAAFTNTSLEDAENLIASKGIAKVMSYAKLKLAVEKAANLKLDRLIKEKVYVRREDVELEEARKWLAVKHGLERTAKALRQVLADTTEPSKIEEILIGAYRAICNEGFGGRW